MNRGGFHEVYAAAQETNRLLHRLDVLKDGQRITATKKPRQPYMLASNGVSVKEETDALARIMGDLSYGRRAVIGDTSRQALAYVQGINRVLSAWVADREYGKWTTDGKAVNAGDVFGDEQVGTAEVLTYTRADRPDERVSVTFGVVFNRAKRYSGEIEVAHEEREHGDWDLVSGTTPWVEHEAFYADHDTIAPAKVDVREAMEHWSSRAFTSEELGIS